MRSSRVISVVPHHAYFPELVRQFFDALLAHRYFVFSKYDMSDAAIELRSNLGVIIFYLHGPSPKLDAWVVSLERTMSGGVREVTTKAPLSAGMTFVTKYRPPRWPIQ